MNKQLTLGSLFSGSGGFELGGLLCGIEPVFASEIEPFPIRVTTKRLPQVKHLGDVNKINGANIPPVDIITAGFPCTDVSCAGRRAGLHAERTGLFFQAIRVIREMLEATNYEFPKFLCFENVPGLLSSNKGADFCEVMDEIAGLGFISDPNILDAQDFGVAQRRKRVYIASVNRKYYNPAVFADAPKSRDKRMEKAVALWGGETFYGIASRPYTPVKQKLTEILQNAVDSKYYLSTAACLGILRRAKARGKELPKLLRVALESQAMHIDGAAPIDAKAEVCILNDQGGGFMNLSENITGTLRSQEHGHQPIVFEPGAISRLGGHCWEGEPTGALRADMGDNRMAVAIENYPIDGRIKLRDDDLVQTLTARCGTGGMNVPLVMNERQYALTAGEDVANTLTGTDYKGTQCVFIPSEADEIPKSAAFMGGQGSDAGSIAYSEDTAPTLRSEAGGNSVPMVMYSPVVFDGKQVTSKDNRSNPKPGAPCHTLSSGSADSAVVCLQGNMIGRKPENGPEGSGVNDDVAFTLTEVDRHAVCYQDVVSPLTTELAHQTGTHGQIGGQLIVEEHHSPICYQDVIGTLAASDYKFPQQQQIFEGKAIVECEAIENYRHSEYRESETAGTLKQCGGTNGGGSETVIVENRYVVRRLTPTECALLQGFPSDWCTELETPEPSDEDIDFWSEVWETNRIIIGKSSKPRSRNQIIKWLKDPYSDSAVYKMWGNGICLWCAVFVLAGIVSYTQNQSAFLP